MEKLQSELNVERLEYRRKEAILQKLHAGAACPMCCRVITEDVLDETRAGIERALQEMVQQGVQKNTQLAQIRILDQKAKEVFEQWKSDDIKKHRDRIAHLERERSDILSAAEETATLADMLEQRGALEESIALGGLTAEEKISLDALEAELSQVQCDYTSLQAILERSAPDIEAKKAELEALIQAKEELISAAMDYLSIRNDLTFRGLPLEHVGFSLLDVMKSTGEVKNAFRFTYDGRDYRKLSHSERIFAGMEVSEMMKALTGRNYPVFVDDSESVVKLAKKPSGQVFLSRVVAGAPLTVVPRNMTQPAQEAKIA